MTSQLVVQRTSISVISPSKKQRAPNFSKVYGTQWEHVVSMSLKKPLIKGEHVYNYKKYHKDSNI